MKCLETRLRSSGIVYRRYALLGGKTHTTFEVPTSVLKALGMGKVRAAMATWQRGEADRARADRIRKIVLGHPGTRVVALANICGITEARVRQIRQEARDGD